MKRVMSRALFALLCLIGLALAVVSYAQMMAGYDDKSPMQQKTCIRGSVENMFTSCQPSNP
jgi:hypothetical protein